MRSSLKLFGYALLAIAAQTAGKVPTARSTSISVRALDGTLMQFPAAFAGHPTVLLISFDRESREQTEAWSRRLAKLSTLSTRDVYQVYVVEPEGSVIARLISNLSRWMDSDVSRSHSLLLPRNSEMWHRVSGPIHGPDAFIVVLDSGAHICWKLEENVTSDGVRVVDEVIPLCGSLH